MKLLRRRFLHLAACAAALPTLPRIALALDYPTRPVRIIVGLPAGSGPDLDTRLISGWLQNRLGQSFVIENRPGAATNVATAEVVRAAPDGYTLLTCATPNAINATLFENINFNFIRDMAPVARIGSDAFVMVVNPSLAAKNIPEFIAYAKANPGKLNMASAGIGSAPHIFGEQFKLMTGVSLVHVPYRGSYISDLLGGQVQVAFSPINTMIAHIRAGRLRALAVTTATRQDVLPGTPTIAEFVPGYEASGWQGISAPANTPREIIEKLNVSINAGLADPQIKARFTSLGSTPTPMTSADFGRFIAKETEKWAMVIKLANIKLE